MDSLIVSFSEFQWVGINSSSDTVTVDYGFKGQEDEKRTFKMTKSNDSTFNVTNGQNLGLIYLRKKYYRK